MRASRFRALPQGPLVAIVLGVAALVWFASWPSAGWAYADWAASSAATRESLVYAGPWAAGWSAWVAGRYLGTRSLLCSPAASRSGWPVVGRQLTGVLTAVAAGQMVGLAPLMVATARHTTAGSMDFLVVAGGFATGAAFGALGYLIGALVPRWIGPGAAVLAAFGAVVLADPLGKVVAPVWQMTTRAGHIETAAVAAFRVLFFVALTVAFAAAAAWCVRERRSVPRITNYTGLGFLIPLLAVAFVARTSAPTAVLRETDPPTVCTKAGGIDVCVHKAKEPLLQPLSALVESVLATVDGRPAVPLMSLSDSALGRQGGSGNENLALQDHLEDWQQWAAADLASFVSGMAACRTVVGPSGSTPAQLDAQGTSLAFARWIVNAAGYSTAYVEPPHTEQVVDLGSLSAAQVRGAYHRFANDLARCALPSAALR